MRFDCHVHTRPNSIRYGDIEHFNHKEFMGDLKKAGLDGAAIYSLSPTMFGEYSLEFRMNSALEICKASENLFPFFWINPLEEGALEQVDIAVEKGYVAFKMIPTFYRIDSDEAMAVIEKIASVGKPIMFHTGISWDGENSSDHHRPGNYEALIHIPNLKFCLAHISWPWTDECIAVFGKFRAAYRSNPNVSCEMFIDVTPGTPDVYREDVFRRMLLSYDMRNSLMFGTDCSIDGRGVVKGYDYSIAKKRMELDDSLYEKYVKEDVEDFKNHVYYKNLLRFLGKDK